MRLSDAYIKRLATLHPMLIDLTLGRVERLLEKLGHPEQRMGQVIHVAGTNGKGSTIAFLRAMLEADGKRVHVYTSPHLVHFHERIRLGAPGGGKFVSEDALVAAFDHVEQVNAGEPITLFEITTVAAFHLFASIPADVTLVEVGLGGTGDATNVFKRPCATVVTPVSMDHREFLGDTVEKIATQKAGIFRKGVSAIIAPQSAATSAVLQKEGERIGATLMVGGQDFAIHEEHGRLVYQDEHGLMELPLPRLKGRQQHTTAATAIATVRTVFGPQFPAAAIEKGLTSVEWPARMQRLTGKLAALAPVESELWLDGGHNVDGARAVAAAIGDLEERHARPLILVLGLMARKDAPAFLETFRGLAQEIYCVDLPGEPLGRSATDLAGIARGRGMPAACAGDLNDTMVFLASRTWPVAPRILIAGSLYLAGEVLSLDGALPR